MAYEIRAATEEEIPDLLEAMAIGFNGDVEHPPDVFAPTAEMERSRCAFDGSKMIGTSGAYSLDLTVPGGAVPTGGTTWVTVHPTYRRQGLLRSMMRAHLGEVRERGEPLAALWASESSIYRRFGYGPAGVQNHFVIDTAFAEFAQPVAGTGAIRVASAEEAGEILPALYEKARKERPGHFGRSRAWWESRRLYDPPRERRGMSPLRYALYERDGEVLGYAQYRTKPSWDDRGTPRSTLWVVEMDVLEPDASAALWRFLLDTDLIATVDAWNVPADETLPWLLRDQRRIAWSRRDSIWLRLLDVSRALEARRYALEDRLVFGVQDSFCESNQGAYELEGGLDGASCRTSGKTPDITLDVSDLASVYLGDNSLRGLARAGRVAGAPSALARADAMFSWSPVPWCPEIF